MQSILQTTYTKLNMDTQSTYRNFTYTFATSACTNKRLAVVTVPSENSVQLEFYGQLSVAQIRAMVHAILALMDELA